MINWGKNMETDDERNEEKQVEGAERLNSKVAESDDIIG